MNPASRKHRQKPHPRGSIYIAVIAMSMIIAMIGVAGISTIMIERKQVEQTNDFTTARYHAQSAVQLAVQRINGNANWRNSLVNGMLFEDMAFGDGRISAWVDDAADGVNDPITVFGYGYHGRARFIISARLTEYLDPAETLSNQIISDGASSYWPMNEPGGTIVNDVVSGNHGRCVNNPTFGHEGIGPDSTCMRFYGESQNTWVDIDHINAYYVDQGTVEFWFKPAAADTYYGLFSKDAANYCNGGHFYMGVIDGGFWARFQSKSSSYELHHYVLPEVGVWYHYVTNFGPAGLELFVNGQLVDTLSYTGGLATSSGGSRNTHPVSIGVYNFGSDCTANSLLSDYYNGYIDEMAFYGQVLTSQQIQKHYELGTRNPPLAVIPGSWKREVDQ